MIVAHPPFSLSPRPLLAAPTSTAQPGENTPLPHFPNPTYRLRILRKRRLHLSVSCPGRRDEGVMVGEGDWAFLCVSTLVPSTVLGR